MEYRDVGISSGDLQRTVLIAKRARDQELGPVCNSLLHDAVGVRAFGDAFEHRHGAAHGLSRCLRPLEERVRPANVRDR
jgi:hypothetical protein